MRRASWKTVAVLSLALAGCSAVEFAQRKPMMFDRPRPQAHVDPSAAPLPSTMPSVAAIALPNVPVARETHLKNGVRVLMLEDHRSPLAGVAVVLQRGSVEAPPGIFELFVDAMTTGSDLIAPKALRLDLDAYAVERSLRIGHETASVETQFIAPLLRDVVRITVPTFATPTFDSDDFDLLLDEHKRKVSRTRGQLESIARRELYKLLFPAGHPLAEDATDVPAPLSGVTRASVKALYDLVGSDDLAVVAAGDITEDKLVPLLEEALGSLKPHARVARVFAPAPPPSTAHLVALDHPGDVQARIALGFAGVKCDDPDYATLYLLAKVLQDGAFGSLRLSHGLTYGASGSIGMTRSPSPVILTAAVDVTRVRSALLDTMGLIRRLNDGVTSGPQLERIKSAAVTGWPSSTATVLDSLHSLETLAGLGLPVDTWAKLRDAIEHVTADELTRVARKYLDPARAQLVVLGDLQHFLFDLNALGISPVEVRTVAR